MMFENIRYHIKWWWQRITRGYDDREVFDAGRYLAKHIAHRLRLFKEADRMGYPAVMCDCDDLSDCKDFDNEADRWEAILDKMIYAFEGIAARDEWEYEIFKRHYLDAGLDFDKFGLNPMSEEERDVFKRAKDELVEHDNKIREGTRLFAEYIEALWD